ncbi:MAG: pantoate--beta-alanine ligase [Endomicrobiales bacterium]|nr:pantoate--beta-alanine ligase [Endomicrobiales bacterium]
MKIIKKSMQMQSTALRLLKKGKSIGFVPTMGALHEGHLSLIKRARKENDVVVVSIFVNPKQFGPNEDYLRYPRPFNRDKQICSDSGVDFIFVPPVSSIYSKGYLTYVQVEKMSDALCGRFRPGHFRGVTTIVAKLFNIVMPAKAYFGMKDYQQLKIIERMARDLNFPVEIIPCPVIRERSGLALSSRNQYLSRDEFNKSSKIFEALKIAEGLIKDQKVKEAKKVAQKIYSHIKKIPNAEIDYIRISDPETLESVTFISLPVLIAVAVWIGRARLIDNIVIK